MNTDLAESAPATAEATPEDVPPPPNILFIITDDQDFYSVGAYRETEPCEADAAGETDLIDTPNIDRLAGEGMLFHNAHHMGAWVGGVCTPSRRMIMSGRSLWRIPTKSGADYDYPPDLPDHTMAAVFNDGGFETMRTCKNGNSYPEANARFTTVNDATRRGSRPWVEGTDSEWHADRVVDFLNTWDTGGRTKPFLVYFGFSHPHDVRHAKPEQLAKYNCVSVNDPTTILSSLSVPDTGWHHISVALDPVSDTVRFTMDDFTDTQGTTASGSTNDGPLVVGAHFDASGAVDAGFDGLLDELSVTSGLLAEAELQPLAGIPEPGPFRILDFGHVGSGFEMTFESDEHFLYDLERSDDLTDGSWSTVRSWIGGAFGANETTLVDEIPPGEERLFWRLRSRAPERP